ncbi:hypothetical protein [Flavobacterium sp.]|uniref:hypothetical protein n=1 Tax=Flavobacterium sp. TaxID=239 RepID=UPI00260F212C|nr:hypothetical protein [Flavobacterium sp.]
MSKYFLLLLLLAQFSFGQQKTKVATYKYGYNGMELIVKNNNGSMIVVSTFNSKKELKEEIARKIYQHYKETNPISGDTIKIKGDNAWVTGKFIIQQKGKLTTLNFYYETVEWDSGLTEIYKNI